MNIQPNSGQVINDDQELAKVLAGVSQQTEDQSMVDPMVAPSAPDLIAPTTPMPSAPASDDFTNNPATIGVTGPAEPSSQPVQNPSPVDPVLDSIKQDAINELRPLVDKLQVSAEEKFDTYLLLLRSTDDRELIAPAHEAAKSIEDETKRAQALLDIIKEIDFFSNNQNPN